MTSIHRSHVARFVLLAAVGVTAAACGASRAPASSPSRNFATPGVAPGSGGGSYDAPSSSGGGDYDGASDGASVAKESSEGWGTKSGSTKPTSPPSPPPPPTSMAGSSSTGVGTSTSTPPGPKTMGPPTPSTGTVTVNTTVIVTPPTPPIVSYPDDQGSPTGGLLTAAIWDDNVARPQFANFVARYPTFNEQWGLDVSKKVVISVIDANGVMVGDAPLALRAPDGEVIQLRTHGDGTALFYPSVKMNTPSFNGQQQTNTYAVAAQVGTLRTETAFAAPTTDTNWTVKLTGVPIRAANPALDVAIVLDTTGSMGDEIGYLQAEFVGVMKRVQKEQATRRVRLGLVLYKDRGDEYVTKTFPFTEDFNVFLSEIKQASAGGGGDMPESVNAALADTVNNLAWAGDETGRMAILVADAPPHYWADEQYTYKNAIWDLSARGIKLVTLGASGIDKSTEYVFREMAAFTGGRYVFLTDDSGVGDSHITPDITGYQVEHLDKILVKVIRDEARSFMR